MKIELSQRDLEDIRKAQAACDRYDAITDVDSPEWEEARREWNERRTLLALMLINKAESREN